jgi:putative PIN family toxin of toxin-antitoxin system
MINDIRKVAEIVHPMQEVKVARDPDDDKILECALEAKAELVLSFDKDLLAMEVYEGIKVVHPSSLKFWFIEK